MQCIEAKDRKITIYFKNIGTGLFSKDGNPLKQFDMASANKKFIWIPP